MFLNEQFVNFIIACTSATSVIIVIIIIIIMMIRVKESIYLNRIKIKAYNELKGTKVFYLYLYNGLQFDTRDIHFVAYVLLGESFHQRKISFNNYYLYEGHTISP